MRNNKLFVEMIRWSGTHKYLLGFYDTFLEAIKAGDAEMNERGGKYGYEIYEPHYYPSTKTEVNELKLKVKATYEKV